MTSTIDYTGYDFFSYAAKDGQSTSDRAGTVFITVTPSTDDYSPSANNVFGSYFPGESVTIRLSGGGPNGDSLTFDIYEPSVRNAERLGVPYCSDDTPSACRVEVTYTPNPGFEGSDSFTCWTFDGENFSNVATVSLASARTPPARRATYRNVRSRPSGRLSSAPKIHTDSVFGRATLPRVRARRETA